MRRLMCLCFIGTFLGACVVANAQEEKTEVLCDPADPANKCPGDDCVCVDDTVEVTFDGDSQSILEYADFVQDQEINITVISDTKTALVQGWSYGMGHDIDDLVLTAASIEGTDAQATMVMGFDATSMENIETCGDEACTPANRTPGGGWISAVVLSLTQPVELPIERNSIAIATYTLSVDVGEEGTLVRVSPDLAKQNSPPAAVNLTVDGKSKNWTSQTMGWIKKESGPCVPDEPDMEVTCDDGLDNDCDGLDELDEPD